ncbi:MAG: chromosome segregation protein SMC, partial [Ruminococcus sp.]|nr:chromosome segregation protein SMC [Ruminococcus sp.]
ESTVRSDELRRKMLEEEQTASKMKSDTAVLENDIKHCETAKFSAEKSIEESEKTRAVLISQRKNVEESISNLEQQRLDLLKEISETEKSFEKAEKDSSQLGDSVDRAGSEINSLYIKQSEYRFSCESSKRTVEEETRRLAELREKSGSYEKTFCGYIEKINLYKENSEKLSEKSKVLKNRLSECEKLCETKKSDFEQAKKDFESVLYELREKEQRRKILHDLDNNMEGFAGSVKSVLRASKQGRINGVFGTVAQNTGVEQKYALAVETALGGAMQNIIVENEETAKQCINFLREQKGGRATFLPVTSVKGRELNEQGLENCTGFEAVASQIVDYDLKFSGIMSSLLGRTVIAENIDCAVVIAKKYGYRFRIVTLDGQVINAGGSFTGGSAQKTAGIITRKNEIDRLDSEIARLSADRDGLREKAEKLRAESEKIRIETENIKSSLSEYGADIARLDSG